MAAVWVRLRAELRPRRRAMLALSLVLAVIAGAAIAAEGRSARTDDEVALDPDTMRALRLRIGDRVNVGGTPDARVRATRALRVVGVFVVPRIPVIGEGAGSAASMTVGALRVLTGGEYEAAYIRLAEGTDLQSGVRVLRHAAGEDVFAVVSRGQGLTARNIARISQVPIALAGLLGLLASATLVHALVTTIRRRGRDLGVLKTIGFVGRQVRATVAWQATTLAVVALVFGVPSGIAAGRWGWRLFAQQIDVVPQPVVPAQLAPLMLAATILFANLIAALPGRSAARTPAAVALRTE